MYNENSPIMEAICGSTHCPCLSRFVRTPSVPLICLELDVCLSMVHVISLD